MLYEALKKYSESDYYPFHMPGHKRRMGMFVNPYELDITEIEGFDNLHHAEGILKNIEEKLSAFYGADESKMLINGSTCGILAAISCCVGKNGRLLTARNCHKAVFNGMLLTGCKASYLYPPYVEEYGIAGGILPEDVRQALETHGDIQAVLITSPTYDGVVSDVRMIADIAHEYGVPLIVDEAHGAHFCCDERFPISALRCGADIVINSLHKTLPSFTQTAVLHMQGDLVDRNQLKKYLSIYQTSSPSYLLMASIENCIDLVKQEGITRYNRLFGYLNKFYSEMKDCRHIRCADRGMIGKNGVFDFDMSKLVLFVRGTSITGAELYERLLEEYHLQMEMAAQNYVIGIATLADEEEGFLRLSRAIAEIDMNIQEGKQDRVKAVWTEPEQVLTLSEADHAKKIRIPLKEAAGKLGGEMVFVYPPGIPFLVPGERINGMVLNQLLSKKESGLKVEGTSDLSAETVLVVDTEINSAKMAE